MTALRVAQQFIEVGIANSPSKARVAQEFIEVGIANTTSKVRIAQEFIEIGIKPNKFDQSTSSLIMG